MHKKVLYNLRCYKLQYSKVILLIIVVLRYP